MDNAIHSTPAMRQSSMRGSLPHSLRQAGAEGVIASVFRDVIVLPKSGILLSFTTLPDGRTVAVGRNRRSFRARAELVIDCLLDELNRQDGDPDLEPSFDFVATGSSDECEDVGDDEPSLGWTVTGAHGETDDREMHEDAEPSLGWTAEVRQLGAQRLGIGWLTDGEADYDVRGGTADRAGRAE